MPGEKGRFTDANAVTSSWAVNSSSMTIEFVVESQSVNTSETTAELWGAVALAQNSSDTSTSLIPRCSFIEKNGCTWLGDVLATDNLPNASQWFARIKLGTKLAPSLLRELSHVLLNALLCAPGSLRVIW